MPDGWNRRTFLTATGVSFAGGIVEAAPYMGKIIDTHVHFYDPTRSQGVPWPSPKEPLLYQKTLPDRFRRATNGLRIAGVIVVEASGWLEDNQWLLDLAKNETLITGIVGRLEPGTAEFPKQLERFAKHELFRGIRLNGGYIKTGLANPRFFEDLGRLAATDLQLDAIGGPAMLPDLLHLADRIPKLRIVIDHMPFEEHGDRAVQKQLNSLKQIYSKVSGVLRNESGRVPADVSFYRAGLDQLWDIFGGDRLIYASNWPVSDKMAPYTTVLSVVRDYFSAKGLEAAERYFFRNSQAAYKWVDRS